jgi:hypothetical protein
VPQRFAKVQVQAARRKLENPYAPAAAHLGIAAKHRICSKRGTSWPAAGLVALSVQYSTPAMAEHTEVLRAGASRAPY